MFGFLRCCTAPPTGTSCCRYAREVGDHGAQQAQLVRAGPVGDAPERRRDDSAPVQEARGARRVACDAVAEEGGRGVLAGAG